MNRVRFQCPECQAIYVHWSSRVKGKRVMCGACEVECQRVLVVRLVYRGSMPILPLQILPLQEEP